jgi:hypothetical protein
VSGAVGTTHPLAVGPPVLIFLLANGFAHNPLVAMKFTRLLPKNEAATSGDGSAH